MKVKINKRHIYVFISLFFVLLYSFTKAGISKYIYQRSIVCYITFIISLLCILKVSRRKHIGIFNTSKIAVIFCLLIVLFNRNANFSNGSFEDGIAFVFISCFYIIASTTNEWHQCFVRLVLFWGMFHASVTIIEYAISGLYMNLIFPLFPEYSHQHLAAVFKNGYMPGLAEHYSTNGMYLAVSFVVCSIYWLTNHQKRKISFMYMLVVGIGLFLTGKRAATVFSMMAIIITYYFYNSNQKLKRIGKIGILIMSGIVIFVVGSQFIPGLENILIRFKETAASGDMFLGRVEQTALALVVFVGSPIVGIGWDGYKYYYKTIYGTLLNVHNVYIQLFAENGILGAIPFLILFTYSLYSVCSLLIYNRRTMKVHDSQMECIISICLAIEVFFLLYSLTGNPLYDEQVFFPYMCALAIVEYYRKNQHNTLIKEKVAE